VIVTNYPFQILNIKTIAYLATIKHHFSLFCYHRILHTCLSARQIYLHKAIVVATHIQEMITIATLLYHHHTSYIKHNMHNSWILKYMSWHRAYEVAQAYHICSKIEFAVLYLLKQPSCEKMCDPKTQGRKRCKIKSGRQETAVIIVQWLIITIQVNLCVLLQGLSTKFT